MSADAVTAWTALLDQLEADVAAVERGDVLNLEPWHPPVNFPTLPVELGDRARSIVRRQRAAIARAFSEKARVGRHLHAVDSVPTFRGTTSGPAAYLDVTG